jgi:quinol monooxygenase YgiN
MDRLFGSGIKLIQEVAEGVLMPVLVATITPLVDQMEAVEVIIKDFVPLVHQEEGCELYALHRGKDCLVLVEKWTDFDALNAHGSGENLRSMNVRLKGLVSGTPNVQVLEALPLGGLKGSL